MPDEMRRAAIVHGITLTEKHEVLKGGNEWREWVEKGVLPERYRKKKDKNNG